MGSLTEEQKFICRICGGQAEVKETEEHDFFVRCEPCGKYILDEASDKYINESRGSDPLFKDRVARWLYETRGHGMRVVHSPLHGYLIEKYRATMALPFDQIRALYRTEQDPISKFNTTLINLARETRVYGEAISGFVHRYIAPTLDRGEGERLFDAIKAAGFIEKVGQYDIRLTHSGLLEASRLQQRPAPTGQVFIACSFKPELQPMRDAIEEVLKELKYKPYILTSVRHNDFIDPKIVDGIRQSMFVIADLTENKQNVYYEVGYGHALGRDVVLTCHENYLNREEHPELYVHFDVEHRLILKWATPEQLKKTLTDHILQCFGSGPSIQPAVVPE